MIILGSSIVLCLSRVDGIVEILASTVQVWTAYDLFGSKIWSWKRLSLYALLTYFIVDNLVFPVKFCYYVVLNQCAQWLVPHSKKSLCWESSKSGQVIAQVRQVTSQVIQKIWWSTAVSTFKWVKRVVWKLSFISTLSITQTISACLQLPNILKDFLTVFWVIG